MLQRRSGKLGSVVLVVLLLTSILGQNSYAQNQTSTANYGPRKQLATIVFAGLAGAVLGLSTLSFYGRPQDKLPNIGLGLGVGIIVGTAYTTYQAATRPRDFYGSEYKWDSEWNQASSRDAFQRSPHRKTAFSVGYAWEF